MLQLSQDTKQALERLAEQGHAASAADAARFPMAIGPLREDRDHQGQPVIVVDAILHTDILRHAHAFRCLCCVDPFACRNAAAGPPSRPRRRQLTCWPLAQRLPCAPIAASLMLAVHSLHTLPDRLVGGPAGSPAQLTLRTCSYRSGRVPTLMQAGVRRPLKMFLVLLVINTVSAKHDVRLDKRFKLPKMRYKGEQPLPQVVRKERPALISEVCTPPGASKAQALHLTMAD